VYTLGRLLDRGAIKFNLLAIHDVGRAAHGSVFPRKVICQVPASDEVSVWLVADARKLADNSPNHLVGAGEHRRRNRETKRLGGS
jgi:hypothetical protein